MKLRVVREPVPVALSFQRCEECGRRMIPYLPECLCGARLHSSPGKSHDLLGPDAAKRPGAHRIAHWSDLHLGSRTPEGLRAEVRVRAMLEALSMLEVDTLVISGDLTRFGQRSELRLAREILSAGGFGPERLVVVPGNHDVPRGMDSAFFREVFEIGFPNLRALAPDLEVLSLDSNVLDRRFLFERRWVPVRGRVGEEALAEAVRLGASPCPGVRIMVLHHHLARLSPESRWYVLDQVTFRADLRLMTPALDSEAILRTALRLGVSAVLHGHKHWYSRTGYRVSSLPVFNAGSLTRMSRPIFRVLDFAGGEWVGLSRVESLY